MNLARRLLDRAPIEPISLDQAREVWTQWRLACGYVGSAPILTPPTGNHKLMKSAYPSYAVSLAPARESGHNVCPYSTPECRVGCIAFAGKGGLSAIRQARVNKTDFLRENPRSFVTLLHHEIGQAIKRHDRPIAVRLNNFSDLRWEQITPWLFDEYRDVEFYDYTKDWARESGPNYHLTYSRSERTPWERVQHFVWSGRNVAVVFGNIPRRESMVKSYGGLPVVDGDATDERFLDPQGVIVGLRAKGILRRPENQGGFVLPLTRIGHVDHDLPIAAMRRHNMGKRLELHTCVAQIVILNDDGTYELEGKPYETENPWAFSDDQAAWDAAASEEGPHYEGWFGFDAVPFDAWLDFSHALRDSFTKE